MNIYKEYYDEVYDDALDWIDSNSGEIQEMIDNDGCSLDDVVTWVINEMGVSDEVCGNEYRGHALPDFIDDVIYDQVFKDAIDTMGIDFSIDFLTNGDGRHYVDSIVRIYCLDGMYCDILNYIYDTFNVEE